MSDAFRDLLRKVGSGSHTSKDLTQAEAAAATRMMLLQEATPAQIGAFMIAHRIKRPTGEELAGILDAYDDLGPKLTPIAAAYQPIILGIPYDGRSRTAPVSPVVALLLAAAGCPVIMHGGQRTPTKEGIPLVEIWQGLGVDWTGLSLDRTQAIFAQSCVGFVYLPTHFPLAQAMVEYRRQIGKRPPFATAELFWLPYQGEALLIAGYVHPPTEEMARSAFALRGEHRFITVKGLEGSCDLSRDRTGIIGFHQHGQATEHLLLHPRDYGFAAADVPLESDQQLIRDLQTVVQGVDSELQESAIWSGGFYLWQGGVCANLETGLTEARRILKNGQVAEKLMELRGLVKAAIGSQPEAVMT